MNDIESAIKLTNPIAPRVTPSDVENACLHATYTTLPSGKTMVCELTLQNGFTVRGFASVVSKENFNEDIGRKVSLNNAEDKVWELLGFALQEKIYINSQVPKD